jgi:threonine dehydratase
VTIPEERGSFRRFCELIGTLPGGPRNVTEFNYRISDAAKAHVFVGLTTQGKGESTKIAANFTRHGFEALDLTHDELAKEHIRHMVGGHSELAKDERLLRFRVSRAPGRPDEVPEPDASRMEHQPVPLPQPGCRLRPHPGRAAGSAQ